MSTSTQKRSTATGLSTEIQRLGRAYPEHGLAFVIMLAMGYSLLAAIRDVMEMFKTRNWGAMLLCIAAGVQIRNNVVTLGADLFGLRLAFPNLIIAGERGAISDMYNFKALHICGQLICLIAPQLAVSQMVLSKNGNCITGEGGFPDTEGGRINAEIFKQWGDIDRKALEEFKITFPSRTATMTNLQAIIPVMAKEFGDLAEGSIAELAVDLKVFMGNGVMPKPSPKVKKIEDVGGKAKVGGKVEATPSKSIVERLRGAATPKSAKASPAAQAEVEEPVEEEEMLEVEEE